MEFESDINFDKYPNIVSNGDEVNQVQWNIYHALISDKVEVVEFLLTQMNPPVWEINNYIENETGLMIASGAGALNVVKYLVEHGANVNMKDKDVDVKNTALMLACGEGHLEVVKYLVEHGAKVNMKNNNNGTALMFASQEGNLEVVRFLVGRGANTNDKTKEGETALDMAREGGYDDIVEFLTIEKNNAKGGYRKKTCKRRNCRRKQTRRK
jgi:ankyrin repeat protein